MKQFCHTIGFVVGLWVPILIAAQFDPRINHWWGLAVLMLAGSGYLLAQKPPKRLGTVEICLRDGDPPKNDSQGVLGRIEALRRSWNPPGACSDDTDRVMGDLEIEIAQHHDPDAPTAPPVDD